MGGIGNLARLGPSAVSEMQGEILVTHIEDARLPKCVMFGELVGPRAARGISPGRPQSFRNERRPVDDCSPGRGGIVAHNGGTMGGTFHGGIDSA